MLGIVRRSFHIKGFGRPEKALAGQRRLGRGYRFDATMLLEICLAQSGGRFISNGGDDRG
jgi:hypothetical protein